MATQTAVELQTWETPISSSLHSKPSIDAPAIALVKAKSSNDTANVTVEQVLPAPNVVTEEIQAWNRPKENVPRVFAAFFSFLILVRIFPMCY